MKKLIKIDFDNTTRERKTEDSFSELYSYDKNNGSFEFEILNDTLTTEQVTALFKFTESNKIWKTTGTVEGNKVHVTFDTSLITQNETVICYLYFDEEQRTSDTFRFKFKVKVSEIDKMNRYEVKERFINNTVIVDRLDVVTKEELKEALKNVGGIATEGLLTEVKAEELFVKKTDAVDNTNFELVKNRVLALELKTDKDTIYDDSEVKERLTTLENKAPVDLSGYATKEELRNVSGSQPLADNLVTKEELEAKHYISDVSNLATKEELQEVRNSQPTVDTSHLVTRDELIAKNYLTEHQSLDNLVTKQELEEKQYLTTHQDLSEYAKKSELYNDSDLKARVEVLEQKTDKDTVYDDTPLKERVTALESKAIEGGAYDDKPIRDRLDVLEAKHDNDTIYDDTEVKRRLTEIESKPTVDTSVFVTDEKLAEKGYLTSHQDISNLATKEELAKVVTKEELEAKHFVTAEVLNSKQYLTEDVLNSKNYLTTHQSLENLVTKDELENKGYLTQHQSLEEYAKKSELYNDTDIKQRLTTLENKPNIDTSNFVTNEQLEGKHYLTEHQSLTHLATTSDLEALRNIAVSKAELSKKLDTTEYNSFKDSVVTKTELAEKGYLTTHQDISNLATKQEVEDTYAKKSELPTPYNDSALVQKIGQLEARVDNDTVYDDTNIKERLTNLENKPTVDTTNFVTNEALEEKHYVTNEQISSTYATKSEIPTPYSDTELVKRITVLENKQDNDTVYNDAELKRRVTALEEKPDVDTSNFVTTAILESKGYLTSHQDTSNFALKSELPQPYNDSALVSRINVLEAKTDNDTIYNDAEVKQRLTALESRPTSQSEMRGTGMPNGVVEAPIGTTYIDTAKTNGALNWIKTTDGGNTGWKVAEGDTGWVLGWQEDTGNNTNRMYFRRKNDVVHVKFNPEIKTSDISGETNLILNLGGYELVSDLSIQGFKPVDDIVQTIYRTSRDIYSSTASTENSEGAQGTGAVIIQYEYYRRDKTGLKLQIVTSDLGVQENHVNPFSYLTEDEWPVQLP